MKEVQLDLTRGEQVHITPACVINQNISFDGGASRAEVISAMKIAKDSAIAAILNDNKGGRAAKHAADLGRANEIAFKGLLMLWQAKLLNAAAHDARR